MLFVDVYNLAILTELVQTQLVRSIHTWWPRLQEYGNHEIFPQRSSGLVDKKGECNCVNLLIA